MDTNVKETENILNSLKDDLKNMPPAQEFLDFKKFRFPKSFDDCQEKSKKNFPRFKGNYLALGLLFGLMYLLFNPYALIIGLSWGVYLFYSNKDDIFELRGMKLTAKHLLMLAIAVTLVSFVFLNKVFINFLIIFSVYFIILISHLFTYESDEELKEVPV